MSEEINLNPEAVAALDRQRELFIEKFGREPEGDDPIFFDPNADTPIPLDPQKVSDFFKQFQTVTSEGTREALDDYERRLAVATPAERRRMRAKARREGDENGREIALIFAYGWYHALGLSPSTAEIAADVQEQMNKDETSGGFPAAPGAAGRLAELVAIALSGLDQRRDRLSELITQADLAQDELHDLAARAKAGDPDATEAEVIAAARQTLNIWRQALQADDDYRAHLPAEVDNASFIAERDTQQERIRLLAEVLPGWEARERRRQRAANDAAIDAPNPTHCAEPGCIKSRVFFDADGNGYCKRHGNQRGLRPHGKVT